MKNRKVILLGKMGELFGREHSIKCNTIQEAMNALDCMRGGLRAYLMECTDKGIDFTVQRGGDIHESLEEIKANQQDFVNSFESGLQLNDEDLVIGPVPQGAGVLGDIIKIVVGVILIYFGWQYMLTAEGWALVGAQFMVAVGAQLALAGIIGMLMPGAPGSKENANSLFNGPINNAKIGIPIPIAYGQTEVGGAVINFGFTKQKMSRAQGFEFISTGAHNSNITHSGTLGAGGAVGEQETFDIHWVLDHPNKMGATE
jgi:predicted phage tail protein